MSQPLPRPNFDVFWRIPELPGLSAIAYDPSRQRLLTADSARIRLWNLRTKEMAITHPAPFDSPVRLLFYSEIHGCYLALVGQSDLHVLSGQNLKELMKLVLHKRQILSYAFHHGRGEMLCIGVDGLFKIVTLSSKKEYCNWVWRDIFTATDRTTWQEKTDRWFGVLFLDEKTDRLFASSEGDVFMWNWRDGKREIKHMKAHPANISGMCSYIDGLESRLVTACVNFEIKVWAVRYNQLAPYATLRGHTGIITSVACDQSRTGLYSFSVQDGTIRWWLVDSASEITTYKIASNDSLVPETQESANDTTTSVLKDVGGGIAALTIEEMTNGSEDKLLFLWKGSKLILLTVKSQSKLLHTTSTPVTMMQSSFFNANTATARLTEGSDIFNQGKPYLILFCENSCVEMVNPVDGMLVHVISISMCREQHLKALRGETDNAGAAAKKRRKKKRGPKLKDMTFAEKRDRQVQRIIRQCARERGEGRRRLVKAKEMHSKEHFVVPVVWTEYVPILGLQAIQWSSGAFDLIELPSGKVASSFDSADAEETTCICFALGPPKIRRETGAYVTANPGYDYHAYTGLTSGMIRVWCAGAESQPICTFKAAEKCIETMFHVENPARLIVVSVDSVCSMWDVAEKKLLSSCNLHNGEIGATLFVPSGPYFILGYKDGAIQQWKVQHTIETVGKARVDRHELVFMGNMEYHVSAIGSLKLSPCGHRMLSVSPGVEIAEWNLDNRQMLRAVLGESACVDADYTGEELGIAMASDCLIMYFPPFVEPKSRSTSAASSSQQQQQQPNSKQPQLLLPKEDRGSTPPNNNPSSARSNYSAAPQSARSNPLSARSNVSTPMANSSQPGTPAFPPSPQNAARSRKMSTLTHLQQAEDEKRRMEQKEKAKAELEAEELRLMRALADDSKPKTQLQLEMAVEKILSTSAPLDALPAMDSFIPPGTLKTSRQRKSTDFTIERYKKRSSSAGTDLLRPKEVKHPPPEPEPENLFYTCKQATVDLHDDDDDDDEEGAGDDDEEYEYDEPYGDDEKYDSTARRSTLLYATIQHEESKRNNNNNKKKKLPKKRVGSPPQQFVDGFNALSGIRSISPGFNSNAAYAADWVQMSLPESGFDAVEMEKQRILRYTQPPRGPLPMDMEEMLPLSKLRSTLGGAVSAPPTMVNTRKTFTSAGMNDSIVTNEPSSNNNLDASMTASLAPTRDKSPQKEVKGAPNPGKGGRFNENPPMPRPLAAEAASIMAEVRGNQETVARMLRGSDGFGPWSEWKPSGGSNATGAEVSSASFPLFTPMVLAVKKSSDAEYYEQFQEPSSNYGISTTVTTFSARKAKKSARNSQRDISPLRESTTKLEKLQQQQMQEHLEQHVQQHLRYYPNSRADQIFSQFHMGGTLHNPSLVAAKRKVKLNLEGQPVGLVARTPKPDELDEMLNANNSSGTEDLLNRHRGEEGHWRYPEDDDVGGGGGGGERSLIRASYGADDRTIVNTADLYAMYSSPPRVITPSEHRANNIMAVRKSPSATTLVTKPVYIGGGNVLKMDSWVRCLAPVVEGEGTMSTLFRGEIRSEEPVVGRGGDLEVEWKRVLLREVGEESLFGAGDVVVDALKPAFGLKRLNVRRAVFDRAVRLVRKNLPRGHILQSVDDISVETIPASQKGIHYLVFDDSERSLPLRRLQDMEGMWKRNRWYPGTGELYERADLLQELFVMLAFKSVFECDVASLHDILVVDNRCLLSVMDSHVFQKHLPITKISDRLLQAMYDHLHHLNMTVHEWKKAISTQEVLDILRSHGYSSSHLTRMHRNVNAVAAFLKELRKRSLMTPGHDFNVTDDSIANTIASFAHKGVKVDAETRVSSRGSTNMTEL